MCAQLYKIRVTSRFKLTWVIQDWWSEVNDTAHSAIQVQSNEISLTHSAIRVQPNEISLTHLTMRVQSNLFMYISRANK